MNIVEYCERMSKFDSKHVEDCTENLKYIKNNELDKMNGCPSTFGLDNHVGLCEITEVKPNRQNEQCLACWKGALAHSDKT